MLVGLLHSSLWIIYSMVWAINNDALLTLFHLFAETKHWNEKRCCYTQPHTVPWWERRRTVWRLPGKLCFFSFNSTVENYLMHFNLQCKLTLFKPFCLFLNTFLCSCKLCAGGWPQWLHWTHPQDPGHPWCWWRGSTERFHPSWWHRDLAGMLQHC